MRVVSFPHTSLQPAPVAAVERAGPRNPDRAPVQNGAEARHENRIDPGSVDAAPARTPRRYLQGDAAMVGIGLTAQNMFHSENSGPAEENIVRATKAYADIDSMRFRRAPFSYRVA